METVKIEDDGNEIVKLKLIVEYLKLVNYDSSIKQANDKIEKINAAKVQIGQRIQASFNIIMQYGTRLFGKDFKHVSQLEFDPQFTFVKLKTIEKQQEVIVQDVKQ